MQAILIANLRLVIFAMWAAIHPGLPKTGNAAEIADAIARTVVEDGDNAPVFGSHAEDAAVMAYFAVRESSLVPSAVGDQGRSFGVWQLRLTAGKKSVLVQARAWMNLLHRGADLCPESPAAVAWGSCQAAPKADRRVARARGLLAAALGPQPSL